MFPKISRNTMKKHTRISMGFFDQRKAKLWLQGGGQQLWQIAWNFSGFLQRSLKPLCFFPGF